MRAGFLTLGIVAAAAGVIALSVAPAEAAKRKRPGYQGDHYASRASTRITVRKRSFLDPGTEVLPGSQHYTDYAWQPFYNPQQIWDPTEHRRNPLPTSFDLPGYSRF